MNETQDFSLLEREFDEARKSNALLHRAMTYHATGHCTLEQALMLACVSLVKMNSYQFEQLLNVELNKPPPIPQCLPHSKLNS